MFSGGIERTVAWNELINIYKEYSFNTDYSFLIFYSKWGRILECFEVNGDMGTKWVTFTMEVPIETYRNQSIYLQSKSVDWFLYDRDIRHEMS